MDIAVGAGCQHKQESPTVRLPVETEPVGIVVESDFVLFENCGKLER